jgi:hypothetical protein
VLLTYLLIPIAGIFTARVVFIDGVMAIQQTSGYNDVSNYENVPEKLFKSFVLFRASDSAIDLFI